MKKTTSLAVASALTVSILAGGIAPVSFAEEEDVYTEDGSAEDMEEYGEEDEESGIDDDVIEDEVPSDVESSYEETVIDDSAIDESALNDATVPDEDGEQAPSSEAVNTNIIQHIVVEGLTTLKESDFRKMITHTKEGERYSKDNVKADLETITKSGSVQNVRARTIISNGELYVVFEATELAEVSEVVIVGNSLIDSKDILGKLLTQPKREFSKENVNKDVEMIKNLYAEKGYIAMVADVNNTNGKVTFNVLEAKVEKIVYSGNKRTKEWVIEKFADGAVKKDEYLTTSAIQTLYTRLMASGLFEEVGIDAEGGSQPNLVILQVAVKEAKTGQWNLGGAYSSQYKAQVVGGVSDNNINGEAKTINFDFGIGKERKTFTFSYIDPFVAKSDTAMRFDLYRTGRNIDNGHFEYDETRTGGTIGMVRPISKDRRTKFFADFDVDFIHVEDKNGRKLQDLKSNTLTLGISNDQRDNPVDPTQGTYVRGGITASSKVFGSDNNFTKFFVDFRNYTKLAAKDVLAARLAVNYSPNDIPYVEQFGIGGIDSVRGLNEDAQKGNKSVLASLEYRHKFNNNLQGVVFVDAGKAWSDIVDNAMKVAYGVGMRVKTGMGMLRFDVAKTPGESVKYMFGIGHSF